MITYIPPSETAAPDTDSLPIPTGAGQIPVSKADGSYEATDAGDIKVNSVAATGELSSASVDTDALSLKSVDEKQQGSITPERFYAADEDTGCSCELHPVDGLTLATTLIEGNIGAAELVMLSSLSDTIFSSKMLTGRFEVLPAFYQTGSTPGTAQLNGTGIGIGMQFICPATCAPTALSFHLSAVGSAGTLGVAIYDITTSTNFTCGTTASISATGWFRHTFTAVQLYEGHQYEIRVTWVSGDLTLTHHRVLPGPGCGHPDSCTGFSTADNWSTETALLTGYRESIPNFVLNSNADHCPQLVYGGNSTVLLPGSAGATTAAGLFLDCSALVAGTLYYLYGYSTGGVLGVEASTVAPTNYALGDFEYKSTDLTRRLLGMLIPEVLIGTSVGPVMVSDRLYVANINPKLRKIGKVNPYTVPTAGAETAELIGAYYSSPASWRADSDDWKVEVLVMMPSLLEAKCSAQTGAAPVIGIALDGKKFNPQFSSIGGAEYGNGPYGHIVANFSASLSRGNHYLYPIAWIRSDIAGQTLNYIYMVRLRGRLTQWLLSMDKFWHKEQK